MFQPFITILGLTYNYCAMADDVFAKPFYRLLKFIMLSHITTCLNGQVTKVWKPLTLAYHSVNFAGIRHCGIRDRTFLIGLLIIKDNFFKELRYFMEGSTPL